MVCCRKATQALHAGQPKTYDIPRAPASPAPTAMHADSGASSSTTWSAPAHDPVHFITAIIEEIPEDNAQLSSNDSEWAILDDEEE